MISSKKAMSNKMTLGFPVECKAEKPEKSDRKSYIMTTFAEK